MRKDYNYFPLLNAYGINSKENFDSLRCLYQSGQKLRNYDEDSIGDFEIQTLLDRRCRRIGRHRTPYMEYLVRWKGYGPEHDLWYRRQDLMDAKMLLRDYDNSHPHNNCPVHGQLDSKDATTLLAEALLAILAKDTLPVIISTYMDANTPWYR
ncbi:hypothetical protein MGYG_02390 [Nannizzia gypsea CBS 118893]|uniref:Chromo domain-containing protein n=1 Tax=Arthroderma gypseum (strain ATCC MYA-4604 / CBS 118893) TaxID=535722 RepID=E4URF7_ARTGP|nr:hypothetical protein MGYG_02390 [Nannizzia gypsea CBS 118893]EFQ99379.1 hypothetical protein MGYG_02390 [Nannizzia gypsea CBS 118893]